MKEEGKAEFSWATVGSQLKFILTGGGGVKIFIWFVIAILIFCIFFDFGLPSFIRFFTGIGCSIWIIRHVMNLSESPEHQGLFQEGKFWLGYARMAYGSKKTGLKEIPQETEYFQPVMTDVKVISGRN